MADPIDDENSDAGSSDEEDLRGLVGLQNLGNTCYMNGALQALSNCQQLTRFILDCPGFLKESGLCHSYSELIKEMWISKTSQYAVPTSIIRNIKCIYPAFRGCAQQDAQEFLRCFLEQLHDELKQPTRENKPQPSMKSNPEEGLDDGDGDVDDDLDHKSDRQSLQETDHETDSACISCNPSNTSLNGDRRSIISDTFEFKISSSVVCSSCNNISTTKETFKDLSIPIPSRDHPYYQLPVNNQNSMDACHSLQPTTSLLSASPNDICKATHRSSSNSLKSYSSTTTMTIKDQQGYHSEYDGDSFKDSQRSYSSIPLTRWFWNWLKYFSNWFWGPQVTLQDCLSIFFGTDPLEGDNEYSCDVCTKKNRGVKFLKICELPEVLCIHFKRYESIGSSKITTHVSFPITGLDLAPFMSESSRPQCTTYKLIACICHHGSSLQNGHYTTYALNCYDDNWYEFDDQCVTSVQTYQVENSEAYILFYQKSTLDDGIERQRVKASRLLKKSLPQINMKKYFISKQWVNKFNTFVEPGPITNHDFLCMHNKVPKDKQPVINELCHPISETVWAYLSELHGGGPECQELTECDLCDSNP